MSRRLTDEDRTNRALREKDFTTQVIAVARIYGWRVAHFRAAMTQRGWRTPVQGDGAGFPDLLLIKGPRMIAAELKRQTVKDVDREQQVWLDAFEGAGADVRVWRPSDFDAIVVELSRRFDDPNI